MFVVFFVLDGVQNLQKNFTQELHVLIPFSTVSTTQCNTYFVRYLNILETVLGVAVEPSPLGCNVNTQR